MRISNIKLKNFRRFTDFEINDIPESAKLIVLTGPNGSGKSSLFDAFLRRHRVDANFGTATDNRYYNRNSEEIISISQQVNISTYSGNNLSKGTVYIRTAYRNDHEFTTTSLKKQGDILANNPLHRLIEPDATVANNYQRLASQAMEDVFINEKNTTTIGDYRNKLIGEVQKPLQRIFADLLFVGVGNPLNEGSFQFDKGETKNFDYKNLSGGEKAAFDLILDLVVKRQSYQDAVYCIDEPEAHMNTKLQGALLEELVNLLPEESQLWIASHSIGMMRKARELYNQNPASVVFLDFSGQNFDQPVVINPSKPTRAFWGSVLDIALDDLATLIAPSQVVICEGNPRSAEPGKNTEHDAKIYQEIFNEEFPDTVFISAGNSKEVQNDFLGIATIIPKIASGIKIIRLIDRDEHHLEDIQEFKHAGINVLSKRHLESYLYDEETLRNLCIKNNKQEVLDDLLQAKDRAMEGVVLRGNPDDDVKKAAGEIYQAIKKLRIVQLGGEGNRAFERRVLSRIIKPGMEVYENLKQDIFGE